MEKLICFVSGTDDACMYPVGNLRGLAVTAESTILMTFNSFRNGTADGDRDTVTLTTTADKMDIITFFWDNTAHKAYGAIIQNFTV